MLYFVVEGKTDSNKLKSIFPECRTIETNGSAINSEIINLIREVSYHNEVIIFTDPDGPGKKIRQEIISHLPNLKHAFVEKAKAIKNKKVGIAQTSRQDIIEALENVISFDKNKLDQKFTWKQYVEAGYVGKASSKEKRTKLCNKLGIPYANSKTLYKWLQMIGYDLER